MQSQIIQKAIILYDLDRYNEVITLLRKELTSLEDIRAAWLYSASLMMLNQTKDALKATELGLRNSPEYYPLLLLRAEMFKHLGLYSKALNDIERALKIAPDDSDCHIMAGSIYLTTDQYNLTLKHAEKALSLEPQSVDARLIKASALFQQDHDLEARKLAQEALSLEPDNPQVMGFIANLTENRTDKRILLGKALRLDPTDKDHQKEFRQHTVHLKRDVSSAMMLMAAVISIWFLTPPEQEFSFLTFLPVVGPMVLLYYSKYFWLTSFMLFTWLLFMGINDTDFFQTGWQAQALLKNSFYLLFFASCSLLASYLLGRLRLSFVVSFSSLKGKWKQYFRARKFDREADYLAELIVSKRTYFYLIGSLLIPLINAIAHRFSPEIFWTCFSVSFAAFYIALVFLVGTPLFRSVLHTLLYSFLTILVTILAGAILDNTIITSTALFIGAAVATHMTYLNGAALKHGK